MTNYTVQPINYCVTEMAVYNNNNNNNNKIVITRMWANAQRDGCPAEYRWRPLFNSAKFG